jgi:hypothetical protein
VDHPAAQVAQLGSALVTTQAASLGSAQRVLQDGRLAQHRTDVCPHQHIQAVGGDLACPAWVPTAAHHQHVHPLAAVVGVRAVVPDVVRQPTPTATQEATQQIFTLRVAPGPLAVAVEPLLSQAKALLGDDGWHRDADPLLAWAEPARLPAAGLGFTPNEGVPAFGRHHLLLVAIGQASIGLIAEDLVDGGGIPELAPRGRRHTLRDQPLRDGVQREPVLDVPGEQLADDLGFAFVDPHTCWVTWTQGIETIAKGWCAPGQQASSAKSRQTTSTHAIGDDRPLVLSHGATDLDDQRVLRVARGWPLQEHDRAARLLELLQQPDLVGVAPGETVRAGDQDRVDIPTRHRVPQAIQSRPIESGAAVPVILIDTLLREMPALCLSVGSHALNLLLDRLRFGLTLGRNPCIRSYLPIHQRPPSSPLRS